jgi:hypothetical protein
MQNDEQGRLAAAARCSLGVSRNLLWGGSGDLCVLEFLPRMRRVFRPHWAIPALGAPFLLAVFGLGAAALIRAIPEVFGAAALICGCALLLALGGLGAGC